MSFGGKPQVPTKSPSPAGMQANDFSSHEEAVAMRWFIGEDWCPVDWVIAEPLNLVTKTTTQKVGKGASTSTDEHFADVAGVTGIGMVDAITAFEVDGEIVWSGLIQRPTNPAHPDYYHATISCDAFELAYIYWGRPDQPVDSLVLGPLGEENPSLAHPAYRFQPVISVKKLKCGSASTVPSLRARLRRFPKPAVGNFAASGSDQGESVVAGVLELGTDPIYGAGLTAEHVVASEWEALSTAVAGGIGYMSPFLDRARPFKDIAKDLFLYYDGFCRLENGKLRPGWHPHNGTTPEGIPTIDMHAFVGKPNWEVATPADTVNDVICVYRDRAEKWKRRPAYGSDSANIRARRAIQPVTVEMLGFLDSAQASRWATEASTTASEGLAEGEGRLRPSKGRRSDGSLILPGDNFVFDDASLQVNQVVRLRKRVDPFIGPLTFDFESERGVFPLPYVPPVDSRPRPGKVFPNSVSRARIWEVPKQVSVNPRSKNPIVVLAQRPSSTAQAPFANFKAKNVVGFKLWISADNASFDQLASVESWGSYGTLREAVPSSPDPRVVKVAFDAAAIDIDRIVSQSAEAASNDNLLLIVGDEVLSISSITLSGLNYDLQCVRGRLGTVPSSHGINSPAWVVWREELQVIDSLGDKQLSTRWFKLQTYTTQVALELADTPSVSHAFVDRKPVRPTGLVASDGPGLIISLKWENPEGSATSEFQVWKSATNNFANAVQVAEVRSTRFLDTFDVPDGQARWYWVRGIDEEEEESDFSDPATATAHAAVGPQGPQGNQGVQGPAGANGATTYFHVAYADSANGVTNFNQTSGKYIGTYVDTNPTDSNNPAAYTWRQFVGAQGPQGNQGIAGTNGANGQTSYLHIKYSPDGGISFTGNGGEDVGAWVGTYVDFTSADSITPSTYTWAKIKGEQGPQGPQGNQGVQGPAGANGATTYFHVAYADSADGTTNFNQTGGKYIGTYVDTNPADSNNPGAYTWRQFVGAQGPQGNQGIAGTNGANGQTSYLHIKYSPDGGTSFTGNGGEDVGAWIGTYVDFTPADSTTVGSYSWARVNGYRDQTPPSNPGTPSIDSGGTYTDHTGKVQAYVVLNIPALPAGAIYQNVLYRQKRTGATGWTISDQPVLTTASKSQIDDLTPGVAYEYALQAFAVGTTSAVVPGQSPGWFYAATKDSEPAAPTGFQVFTPTQRPIPLRINANHLPSWGATMQWDSSVDGDVVEYYFWFKLFPGQTIVKTNPDVRVRGNSYVWYDSGFLNQAYVWVSSKNSSGVISEPVYAGFSLASYWGVSGGTLAGQNSDSVETTGITTGGGASNKKEFVVHHDNIVVNSSGGGTFNYSLAGLGFGNRPSSGDANFSSWSPETLPVVAEYNWDASTSTNAVFNFHYPDGSLVPSGGTYRFTINLNETD